MKYVALTLAALACAKFATVDYLYKAATRDALVTAFGTQAVAACQKAQRPADSLNSGGLKPDPLWGTPGQVRVEIGNRNNTIALWQVDHQDWPARFRRAFIVLDASAGTSSSRCHFDVVAGTATVSDL